MNGSNGGMGGSREVKGSFTSYDEKWISWFMEIVETKNPAFAGFLFMRRVGFVIFKLTDYQLVN